MILILDDEEKLRMLMARIIGLEGYEVLQAGDCRTAKKYLAQHEITVLLCDVKLPDGNGVDFTREVKSAYPLWR